MIRGEEGNLPLHSGKEHGIRAWSMIQREGTMSSGIDSKTSGGRCLISSGDQLWAGNSLSTTALPQECPVKAYRTTIHSLSVFALDPLTLNRQFVMGIGIPCVSSLTTPTKSSPTPFPGPNVAVI